MFLADDGHRGEPIFLRLRFAFRRPKVERETAAVCGGQPGPRIALSFGVDDKVFRLERWSDETCAALARDAEERPRMKAP